jgi:uncharacterized protein YukE
MKHDARVANCRARMEKNKANKQNEDNEAYELLKKQNRLKQRVKCSPALVSNSATLAQKKYATQQKIKQDMRNFQRAYDQIKANIKWNVAHKPLLVEQVSKAFIHNLKQIKELQQYVNMLRVAGMNPDEHLTDE